MKKRRLRRFKTQITQIFVLVAVLWFLVSEGYAQTISSSELINNAKHYDGKIVTYQGEVIGDVMARGEFAWLNVNDGVNAIGIWLDKNSTRDIIYTGSYKARGDLIEVSGVFNRACLVHGGDLDIHAQTIRKLSPGKLTPESLNEKMRNLSFILLGALCLVLILKRSRPAQKQK